MCVCETERSSHNGADREEKCSRYPVHWRFSCSLPSAALFPSHTFVCTQSQTPLVRSDCEGEDITLINPVKTLIVSIKENFFDCTNHKKTPTYFFSFYVHIFKDEWIFDTSAVPFSASLL